ncbi:YncE family protein [Gaopeijia maritima]|uniref:YncE family protein n=1 Tax=Gaopeijia maritima TaxID=3119007 RepID=A0ABU9E3Z8_9BACT
MTRSNSFSRLAAAALGVALVSAPLSAQDYLYANAQGEAKVAVIDIATLQVAHTVDLTTLGFSENAKPHHVAVEPDGSFWYVSLIGENRVLKFDRNNELVGQAEFEVPGMLAIDPNDDLLYVGRSMSAVNPPQRIGVIERSTMSVDEIDVLFPRPHALIVHPSGAQVYSASLGVNQLAAVDAESWDVELVNVPGETHALVQFAVSPDGGTLVATTELTGTLQVFDLTDPASPAFVRSIEVGTQPWHPVYGRDGRHVYFGNKADNTIVEVDVEGGRISRTFDTPEADHPHGSALSPDGRLLFVSNNGPGGMDMAMGGDEPMDHGAMAMDHGAHAMEEEGLGTLTVIDLDSGRVVATIPVGDNATGVAARYPR